MYLFVTAFHLTRTYSMNFYWHLWRSKLFLILDIFNKNKITGSNFLNDIKKKNYLDYYYSKSSSLIILE